MHVRFQTSRMILLYLKIGSRKWFCQTKNRASHMKCYELAAFPLSLFSTFMIVANVFQLRVVTGTPKMLSIVPRYRMAFIWRRYIPKTNLLSVARIFNSQSPSGGRLRGKDG